MKNKCVNQSLTTPSTRTELRHLNETILELLGDRTQPGLEQLAALHYRRADIWKTSADTSRDSYLAQVLQLAAARDEQVASSFERQLFTERFFAELEAGEPR